MIPVGKPCLTQDGSKNVLMQQLSGAGFVTRIVQAGTLLIGGNEPIRVQSMTTTDTMNTMATVEQAIRMIKAGCELVRITAPSMKEAENLKNIKNELHKRGYFIPLAADIHYTPNAAEAAARIVEKVRINPGNYVAKKRTENTDYTESAYNEELDRIRKKFVPLIKICKEYGTAMRIGTNHGSLSDRIMNRFGDSPSGMVESALEFVRICEEHDYHNIVLSMKSSNPQVMVQAYRQLVDKMMHEGMNYPLHLGVTEAGEGEDGRIKSAAGIGTLLEDGIGDTIRVSLTEEPEHEMPVAIALASRYKKRTEQQHVSGFGFRVPDLNYSPFEYNKRRTVQVLNTGGNNVPRVIVDFSDKKEIFPSDFSDAGYNYAASSGKWILSEQACDYIFLGNHIIDFKTPETLGLIYNAATWEKLNNAAGSYPLFSTKEFLAATQKSDILNFVCINLDLPVPLPENLYLTSCPVVFIIETEQKQGLTEQKRMFSALLQNDCKIPVIIKREYDNISEEEFRLYAAADTGALLIDGFGDGIWINHKPQTANRKLINATAFGILQATRTRISKTEYISCPSCGRTLFDLQETTARIRQQTGHLKGVKIGIMGCIVNGPGEMADADYGYVGTGVGKVTLYKRKNIVKRNVDAEQAVEALINLIKEDGKWVERGFDAGG